jgi:hypothetical protein
MAAFQPYALPDLASVPVSSASRNGVAVSADSEVTVTLGAYPPAIHTTGTSSVGSLFALPLGLGLLLLFLAFRRETKPSEEARVESAGSEKAADLKEGIERDETRW